MPTHEPVPQQQRMQLVEKELEEQTGSVGLQQFMRHRHYLKATPSQNTGLISEEVTVGNDAAETHLQQH
jgi:hypothetical protein